MTELSPTARSSVEWSAIGLERELAAAERRAAGRAAVAVGETVILLALPHRLY